MRHGVPTVCVPDPRSGPACGRSTTRATINGGGPHGDDATRSATSTAGAMDGFVRTRRGAPGTCCAASPVDPELRRDTSRPARRDGLPRRAARSRTTGRTRSTSCCRTTCSSRCVVEPARRTSRWSPAGRPTCSTPNDPMSCTNATSTVRPDLRAASATVRLDARSPGPTSPTCSHRARRELGVLRRDGHAARLRGRRASTCAAAAAERVARPSIWNPLPYFDGRAARTASSATSSTVDDFYAAARAGHAAERLAGSSRTRTQSASTRPSRVGDGQA